MSDQSLTTTPPSAPTGLASRRLRDVGLVAAIFGAMLLGYLQFRMAMPQSVEAIDVTVLSDMRQTTTMGTTQHIVRARLADGTEVDVLVPLATALTAGETLSVERLTTTAGAVHYRAAVTVKTGR